MQHFRVTVHLHRAYWCQVDIEHAAAEHALADVIRRFPEGEGYTLDIQRKTGERRLLESTPDGIRLLYAQGMFERLSAECSSANRK
jgi:hypothetical protein